MESKNTKNCVLCLVTQLCPTLCDPMDSTLPVLGDSSDKNTRGVPCPSPGDLPDPEIKPRSPTLQADSLPTETPGKPTKKSSDYNKKEADSQIERTK